MIAPNIMIATQKLAMLARVKIEERNSRSGTTGSSARDSMNRKIARKITPTT